MLSKLAEIIASIYDATDHDRLYQAVNCGCQGIGFDSFVLTCDKPIGPDLMLDSTLHSLPADFLADYERLSWYKQDFVTHSMLSCTKAFMWNGEAALAASEESTSYRDFLHENKMISALIVPLGRTASTASAMSFIRNGSCDDPKQTLSAARIVAMASQCKAEMLGLSTRISIDEASSLKLLSDRQVEILRWISMGKSNRDIAGIMSMRERTVRYHVSEILDKLGVVSRAQAVSIGIMGRSFKG